MPPLCAMLGVVYIGDLWMWLKLMWLQFEVVQGPVGVVWNRFGARFGVLWAPNRPPKTTFKLQPHEL